MLRRPQGAPKRHRHRRQQMDLFRRGGCCSAGLSQSITELPTVDFPCITVLSVAARANVPYLKRRFEFNELAGVFHYDKARCCQNPAAQRWSFAEASEDFAVPRSYGVLLP
jgi:hypothetical protein